MPLASYSRPVFFDANVSMRLLPCMLLLLLCAAAALAADEKLPPQFGPLHILEVGLNGEYVGGQPTSVRLRIANPRAQPLRLDLRVNAASRTPNQRAMLGGGDSFTAQIVLDANETRELELPVILPYANADMRMEASATAADGRVFAYDRIKGDKLSTRSVEGNVGLLCGGDQTCKDVQQQAQFSGTMEERVDKNKKLHFITVLGPRSHWWPYSTLQSMVVAAPMSGYTPGQRAAIEDFLRRGGRLILLG